MCVLCSSLNRIAIEYKDPIKKNKPLKAHLT